MGLKRISSKIMGIIIGCCVFTAFLVGGFSLYQGSKYVKAEANSKLTYISRSYANEFSQTFERTESQVNSIYDIILATFDTEQFKENPDYLEGYLNTFEPIMSRFANGNETMLGIYFTLNPAVTGKAYEIWYEDLSGNGEFHKVTPETVSTYAPEHAEGWAVYPNTPEFLDPNNQAMEYLYRTMDEKKPMWYEPYEELGLDVTAISYVMPIIIDDMVIGVVGMDLNFETIRNTIDDMVIYPDGYAFLLNEAGSVIVEPDFQEIGFLKAINDGDDSGMKEKILEDSYGSITYTHQKTMEMISYSKLTNGWILVLSAPYQEVFQPVENLSVIIVGLTLIGIAISIAVAYAFARRVSVTMDQAAEQLRYIEIGDFTQEIPIELLKGEDDLGAFIKSVHTLKTVIRDLIKNMETNDRGSFADDALLISAVQKTQKASNHAVFAIEQISIERFENAETLKESLQQLEEFNCKLQNMVNEEVQKNRQKDAVVIYQSRLAKMGEMIGNITHQWRQPLNSISIILSELKDSFSYGELDEQYLEESVRKAKQIIGKMSNTIDDFMNYLSPSKEEIPFSVKKSTEFILELMEETLQANGIHVKTNIPESAFVIGYENEFSQVVSNIVNNGKEALEESGLLQKNIWIDTECSSDILTLKICNNGNPIKSEVLEKMFTPYFTTKTLGKGTGIGLYMSKIMIEDHMGGTIHFENLNDGVCCVLTLPLYQTEA